MEIFHQSSKETAGPACLVMALKHFGLENALSPALESSIRAYCLRSNEVEPSSAPPPISHADLARYWLNRGGQARLYHQDPAPLLQDPTWQPRLARFLAVEQEAIDQGLDLVLREPTYELLFDEINSGALALIRITLEGSTHQQLVYEMAENEARVACPLEGEISYSPSQMMNVMAYPPIGRGTLVLRK